MNSLGFETVINVKRDFYADIRKDKVPEHDVLVTNPPYSGDHKARLFSWILDRQRSALAPGHEGGRGAPFMLLLPAWTAKWLAWRSFLWALARVRKGRTETTMEDAKRRVHKLANLQQDAKLERKAGVFYLAPAEKYEYTAAVSSRDSAPFFGIWFCGGFGDDDARMVAVAALEKSLAKLRARRSAAGECDAEHELEGASRGKERGGDSAQSADAMHGHSGGGVMESLRALAEAGYMVGVEEERAAALEDPAVRQRRDAAIAALQESRKVFAYLCRSMSALALHLCRSISLPLSLSLCMLAFSRPGGQGLLTRRCQGKKRKRNFDEREHVTYTPKKPGEAGREDLERVLALPQNARACTHFFIGRGCVRGDKCKFAHVLHG